MSYAMAPALQKAIYEALTGDVGLAALVGGAIFDAPPVGTVPETYVTLGPERVRDRSDMTSQGAEHDVTVSTVTAVDGFQAAKAIAVAVNDALTGPLPALNRGRLVRLDFLKARARREAAGQTRRIDLTFRARVEDD